MRLATLALTALLVAGCSKVNRLSEAELAHYTALKPFWDKGEEKAFLKGKTQEERDAWLKAHPVEFSEDGNPNTPTYYERYYQYDEKRRAQIAAGQVQPGWTYDQVVMAWGNPHKKKRLAGRPATRSELYVYRFEVDWEGITHVWVPGSKLTSKATDLFQLDVYIDDGVVTEMDRKEDWE